MKNRLKYRVHRVEVNKDKIQEQLEQFLNTLRGRVLAVVPHVRPTFQMMGATSKVDFLLVVEQLN